MCVSWEELSSECVCMCLGGGGEILLLLHQHLLLCLREWGNTDSASSGVSHLKHLRDL